jgi:PKHD-type hydroxylase
MAHRFEGARMILCLPDVLTPAELQEIRGLARSLAFVDGAATAGQFARTVKRNEQAESGPSTQRIQQTIMAALFRHPRFEMAIRPKAMKPIMVSRYEPGMEYGTHVDNAVMSGKPPIRSDVSMTIFLADPETYDGGELVMETGAGEQAFKLKAGSAITYPSYTLHRVAPLARGQRLAAVTWIQSLIRDAMHREILYDLETTRRSIFESQGKTREFDLVSKSFANLMRMWVDV